MQTTSLLTNSGEVLGRAGSGSELPARREALTALSRPVPGIHDRRKALPPALAAKALENEPFEDLPRAAWEYRRRAAGVGDDLDKPLSARLNASKEVQFRMSFDTWLRGEHA